MRPTPAPVGPPLSMSSRYTVTRLLTETAPRADLTCTDHANTVREAPRKQLSQPQTASMPDKTDSTHARSSAAAKKRRATRHLEGGEGGGELRQSAGGRHARGAGRGRAHGGVNGGSAGAAQHTIQHEAQRRTASKTGWMEAERSWSVQKDPAKRVAGKSVDLVRRTAVNSASANTVTRSGRSGKPAASTSAIWTAREAHVSLATDTASVGARNKQEQEMVSQQPGLSEVQQTRRRTAHAQGVNLKCSSSANAAGFKQRVRTLGRGGGGRGVIDRRDRDLQHLRVQLGAGAVKQGDQHRGAAEVVRGRLELQRRGLQNKVQTQSNQDRQHKSTRAGPRRHRITNQA